MLRKSLLLITLFTLVQSARSQNLVVEVTKGDGIFSILRRYNLYQNSCNLDSFLQLNSLSPTDYLKLGKKYKLPIKAINYDGKSIRSSCGISDYDKAVRIQKYNDDLTKSGIKQADYRTDKILWIPYHELFCIAESNGFKSYTMTAPIMGPNYQEITIENESLKGCVYYLLSGHGGPDPGAMTIKDGEYVCEDEYAYDVTLRLARNLLSHGATVYMILRDNNDGIRDLTYLGHDKDEVCWPNQKIPLNQTARLKQGVMAINDLYSKHADAKLHKMVSIHVDSRNEGEKIDIFFYHFPGSKSGKESADTLLSTIDRKYNEHQKNRGYKGVVKARDLYVLRESKPSAVYIELGNITNDFDQKRLLIVDNRQAIANWLALGLQTDAKRILKR